MLRLSGLLLLLSLVSSLVSLPVFAQDSCDLTSAGAFTERARARANNGDYQGAIADFTCAINLTPNDVDLYNERGIVYDDLRQYANALADYERALEIDPDYSFAYNNRGNVFYARGDYDRAIADYTSSIELENPQLHIPYYNRGNAHQEQGDYEEALADLTRAIEINDQYASAYLSRAWTYLVLNDDRAHADFAQWIELTQAEEIQQPLSEATASNPLTLTDGLVYRLTFFGETGQAFKAAALTDSTVDPLLVLLDPNGNAVISDDDSGVNLNAVISNYVLTMTGNYTLLLSHAGIRDEGAVELSVSLGGEDVVTADDGADVGADADDVFTTYNLFVDDIAEVFTTEGDRLNVRSGPGLDFDIVTQLERGTQVTLLEGPRKSDGYAWWRIRTPDGDEGWSVERVEVEQTLHLALFAGEGAIVTSGGDLLNVRAEPARGGELLFQLEDGVIVTLTGEPVTADNFRWWPIRDTAGREGWTVDRIGLERMLIPGREMR